MQAKELMIGDLVKVILTKSHPIESALNIIEKITSNKEQIIRCEYIMPNSIAYNKYSENFKINMSIPVVEEDIHPIPLTPEILELNGFYLGRTSQEEDMTSATGIPIGYEPRWCIDDGDVEVTVSFPNESDGGMVTVDNLKDKHMQFNFDETIFVHEFQQILRLCGLNEFENNFKVE